MALDIRCAAGGKIKKRSEPYEEIVDIQADTEAEITALGEVVTDAEGRSVIPLPRSTAYTADASVGYRLNGSRMWVKFKG